MQTSHIDHIEDLIVKYGYAGASQSLVYFRSLVDERSTKLRITLKVDGSPSVSLCSSFPGYPFPFVGLKSVVSSSPKIYSSEESIDKNFADVNLAKKLKLALKYAKYFPKGEVWRGDFLFSNSDLKVIDDFLTFKPNLITYGIDKASPLAERLKTCDIGIAFHTRYGGADLPEAERYVTYEVDPKEIPSIESTYLVDTPTAMHCRMQGYERASFNLLLRDMESLADYVKDTANLISSDLEFSKLLSQYRNARIREGIQHEDPGEQYRRELISWIEEKYVAKASTLKTDKGREGWYSKLEFLQDRIEDYDLESIVAFQNKAIDFKNTILRSLESSCELKAFVEKDGKLEPTSHEGYVLSLPEQLPVKLVDRLTFSKLNFEAHED